MGSFGTLFLSRRWMYVVYIFALFSLFVYMVGYSPTSSLMHVVGWPQVQLIEIPTKHIPCVSRKNIVFLKTHKCASSSVQNILMQYAHRNNLTLLIPINPKSHYFPQVKPFRKEMVAGAPWEVLGYNISCQHMIYNVEAVEKLMPQDTVYLTIIRHPVNLFESLYEYSRLEETYHMDIEEYARGTRNATITPKLRIRSNGLGRNQMLFDLGIHPSYFNNRALVEKAIKKLDSHFDFVLISEYFDESMVILRHILCWDIDDIISLTVNARMNNYKKNLTSEAFKYLEEWNWADKMLYDHFLRKYKETVKEFGEARLYKEVKELKERRNEWFEYCIQNRVESNNVTLFKIWSKKVAGYVLKANVHNMTCEDLVKPENYFTSELRQQQLIRSIRKGAILPTYGPTALNRLLDMKFLKGNDLIFARNLLLNQYKYRRKFAHNFNSRKN